MYLIRRIANTFMIARHALFPREKKNGGPGKTAVSCPQTLPGLPPANLEAYFPDYSGFNLSVHRGELDIFLPECMFPAAIAVLFRLKRQGFSGCRARLENGGIKITGYR